MRILFRLGLAACLAAAAGACDAADKLREGFATTPEDVQTSVYWYWLSGNVSKQGVVADLHSMKQAGIDRAFIGNIGLPEWEIGPAGPVKLLSEEWYEIMHTAMKTATELGIDIGTFNCPGWSQSGGPWVKPSQAMRYLAAVRAQVDGGAPGEAVRVPLTASSGDFQDVRVLAYPAPQGVERLSLSEARVAGPAGVELAFDADRETALRFPAGGDATLEVRPSKGFTLRSLRLRPTHNHISADAELQAVVNGQVRTLKAFRISRVHSGTEVGFDPWAPVTVACEPTRAEAFRLVLRGLTPGSGVAEIEFSEHPFVERYSEKSLAKMHQTELPLWGDYMWEESAAAMDTALAVEPASVVDISECLQGDTLVWKAPAGRWVVLRTGMMPTGVMNGPSLREDMGLEVDKWSREHLATHYDAYVGELLRRIPAADRKAWKVIVADSYERGGQNFSDDFFEYFHEHYGYDPQPYLPVLSGVVVGDRDRSDRFLWDVRRMMADRLSYDHIGAMRELAHRDGLTTWLENYGHWGFPGEFLQYGGQSDEVGGEFWAEGSLGDIENRAASSCAHIYNKVKVSSESFTCAHNPFARYPAVIKQRGDRFFSEGVNNTLLHVYITQPAEGPKPGMNAWFGTEFNRNNTWFTQLDQFIHYIKRCNYMLRQGLNVADAAYFIGEDAPKMTGVTDPALPAGYQWDYINAEVLVRDATVRDGLLTLPHGTQYRVLVLPRQQTMRPAVMAKVRELVRAGAVVVGPAPRCSPSLEGYPQADAQVAAMAAEVWGAAPAQGQMRMNRYGKGMVFSDCTMEQVFEQIGLVPDCAVQTGVPVLYGHRTTDGAEIYFLTNQSDRPIDFTASFRIEGRQPEWWEPTSGAMRRLPAFRASQSRTDVPLHLEPLESGFVVFTEQAESAQPEGGVRVNFPEPESEAVVEGPWQVTFAPGTAQEQVRRFDVLTDWARSQEDTLRYFSGTALYAKTLDVPGIEPGVTYYLDLNRVAVMAKVRVNGEYAGGAWTAPYRVDLTSLLREGENQVEIEVVNTWVNRLVGDQRLPQEARTTWAAFNTYNAGSPLQESGLIGPVTLQRVRYGE